MCKNLQKKTFTFVAYTQDFFSFLFDSSHAVTVTLISFHWLAGRLLNLDCLLNSHICTSLYKKTQAAYSFFSKSEMYFLLWVSTILHHFSFFGNKFSSLEVEVHLIVLQVHNSCFLLPSSKKGEKDKTLLYDFAKFDFC